MINLNNLKLIISFLMGAFAASVILQGPAMLNWGRSFLPSKGKVWNWCPQKVNKVVLLASNKSYSKPEELKILCAAVIEPVGSAKKGTDQMFQVVMKAQNPDGATTFVERSQDETLFRVDGQVFPSNHLQRILRLYLE